MSEHSEWDGVDRRLPSQWHVAREIPIAVLLTLVLQTGAGVWFLASLSAKVDSTLETLREFRQERYTKADAERDRELFRQALAAMNAAHVDISRRLEKLESEAHPEERKAVGRMTR